MKTQRVLLLSDIHLRPPSGSTPSGEDTDSLRAVERYVKDHQWDRVVQLGDLVDLDCISHHNHGKPLLTESRRLQLDYDYANAWLDRWQKATGSAKWSIIEGNHEHRAQRYVEAYPVMQGKVEPADALGLARRGIEWIPYWSKGSLLQIGNAYFGHGRSLAKYHSNVNLQAYGVPFFYGHTHDIQESGLTRWGDDKTICSKSYGCLCRYDQPYMQGRPSKWQQAFGVFHFQQNGFFNEFTVKIFQHSFTSPEGEVYRGAK